MAFFLSLISGRFLKIGIAVVAILFFAGLIWWWRGHFSEFERLKAREVHLSEHLRAEVARSQQNQLAYKRQEAALRAAISSVDRQLTNEKRWGDQARGQLIKLQGVSPDQDGDLAPVLRDPPWLFSPAGNLDSSGSGGDPAGGAGKP
ncbi:hypothetical protein [Kiloniella laminariae]|uniref:hypothetical protein n=1 Tax=Kiloniella laminariae TaxID=454162 RepID=UPI00037FE46D|nr:hypothetical protein [Kiloniella laminariae]